TPSEPIDSFSMGDEHLYTIPAIESDELIKSCVKNLIPNPSESEGESEYDVPASFTTFSNVLFDVDYDFDSGDDQSVSDEDFPKKIYSNPLFEIDLPFTPDDPMPSGIEDDDYDSERDISIFEELLDNYSLSLPANESYHFDIPSPYRPPTKPPDGKTGTLSIKMLGDVSD
nr:hypothetical protein [Tanacetum cinerariifolium]